MAVRAPHLHLTLRAFCLGAFVFLGRALEEGDELPFAFEEHVQRDGPALYEYRPLVRAFVERARERAGGREDARIALDELLREPAAAIFARAHAGPRPTEEQALFRTVLLSLLISTAEACGGFDWDDTLLRARLRRARALALRRVARLRGRRAARRHLGRDPGRARRRDPHPRRRDGRARSPLARGAGPAPARLRARGRPLLRARAGARRSRPGRSRRTRRPSSPTPSPRSGSRPAAPVAAGPVLFERLDWRPFGIRPVLPIAATQPPGEPTRLDSFRAELARELLARLALADADTALAEALDRWELSLFQTRAVPLRAAARRPRRPARRHAGSCAPRCSSATRARSAARIHAALRALASGEQAVGACRGRRPPLARRDAPPRRPGRARALARRHAARPADGAARRDRLAGRTGTHS